MTGFFYNPGRYEVSSQFVKKILEFSRHQDNNINSKVEINIIDDAEMKKLNFVWRGKNVTTDVLSFAWGEDKKFRSDLLGQIFISYPQVKRQAQELEVDFKQEFARMLVHGLLHLAGYDHKRAKEAKKMFNLQEKIVKKIV